MEYTTFCSLNLGDLFISVEDLKKGGAKEGRPLLKKVRVGEKDMALHVLGSGLIFEVQNSLPVIVVKVK